jgi:hypothetical protein
MKRTVYLSFVFLFSAAFLIQCNQGGQIKTSATDDSFENTVRSSKAKSPRVMKTLKNGGLTFTQSHLRVHRTSSSFYWMIRDLVT